MELVIHQLDKRHIIQAKNDCSGQTKEEGAQSCCVEKVEVDFQELGWDFILSPRSLQFSFCRGSCDPHIVRPALFTQAANAISQAIQLRRTSGSFRNEAASASA